jgi:hypothetical protein
VFLGYSALYKGYKCLDTDSGRVYISRDVVFDEHVLPFARQPPTISQTQPQSPINYVSHVLPLNISSTNLNCDHMHVSVPANSVDEANPSGQIDSHSLGAFESASDQHHQ